VFFKLFAFCFIHQKWLYLAIYRHCTIKKAPLVYSTKSAQIFHSLNRDL
jgi:hypothetical protein